MKLYLLIPLVKPVVSRIPIIDHPDFDCSIFLVKNISASIYFRLSSLVNFDMKFGWKYHRLWSWYVSFVVAFTPRSVNFLIPLCRMYWTCSSPICPLCSHSSVHSKNNSYFLGIKTQLNKELFEVCAG